MKKRISLLVLLAFIAGGLFALDLSAGGGLLFDYSANNGLKATVGGQDYYRGIRVASFGGFVFFDATYAEANVSFAYGSGTYVWDEGSSSGTLDYGSMLQLGFTLLGKYPFKLKAVTLYPLLGINYNLVVSAKDKAGNKADKPGDLNQFGIQLGGGVDYYLTEALFIRGEILFQLRFASKYQDDQVKVVKAQYGISPDTTVGMGPVIKAAVGYKF